MNYTHTGAGIGEKERESATAARVFQFGPFNWMIQIVTTIQEGTQQYRGAHNKNVFRVLLVSLGKGR